MAIKEKPAVMILPPGPPRNEDTCDGRERLLRDFILQIDGERFVCPEGMTHDGSSWPRCAPGPRHRRIKRAGIVHDCACQLGTFGAGGRKISYRECNTLWYKVARSGEHKDVRAGLVWGVIGRIGLAVGCYPTWRRYRAAD
jgi:hypothetical protein